MREADMMDENLNLEVTDPEFIKELHSMWAADISNVDMKLQYAMGLSRSAATSDKFRSVDIFLDFIKSRIYVPESLYALSCVYYSMKQYEVARNFAEELLMLNPENVQAKDIHKAIVYKQGRENQETKDIVLWTAGVGLAALTAIAVVRAMKK